MASFPTIRSGSIAMYGTTQTFKRSIRKIEFENGSEQRWRAVRQLFSGKLKFDNLSGYDYSIVLEFFNSSKGQLDRTWDITIDGQTWSYMTFTQDSLDATVDRFGSYSFELSCRQVRKN